MVATATIGARAIWINKKDRDRRSFLWGIAKLKNIEIDMRCSRMPGVIVRLWFLRRKTQKQAVPQDEYIHILGLRLAQDLRTCYVLSSK